MQLEASSIFQLVGWVGTLVAGSFYIRGAYEKALQAMTTANNKLELNLVKEVSSLRTDIQLLQQSHQTAIGTIGERMTRVEEQQRLGHSELERQRDRTTRLSKDVAHLQGTLNIPVARNSMDNTDSGV